MNFNEASCNTNLKNMGVGECNQILGTWEQIDFTLDDFEFATKDDVTEAAYKTGIQAGNVFPFPIIHGVTSSDTEDSSYTSANGVVTIPTARGRWVKTLIFQMPLYLMKNLSSFQGFGGRAIITDSYGNKLGTTEDQVKFRGLSVRNTRIGTPTIAEGKDGVMLVPVTLEFDKEDEYNKDIAVVKTDWSDMINGLQDVTVSIVDSTASLVTVRVVRDSNGTGVAGLVTTDIAIVNDEGAVQAASSFTPSVTTPGDYALAYSTPLVDDTYLANLVAAISMTTQGYESTGSATFTIST